MNRYRRIEIIEPSPPPSLFLKQTSIFTPSSSLFAFEDDDHLDFNFHHFDTFTDLLQIDRTTPHHTTSTRRVLVHHRVAAESYLQTLCDRVSALELTFDKLVNNAKPHHHGDRKYTWTAEVNDKHGLDRKYKWTAEIKGGENNKKEKKEVVKGGGTAEKKKKYKWTAEIKDKREESPISRKYVFEVSTGDGADCSGSEKKEKKKDCKKDKKKECGNGVGPHARLVEIEETSNNNHGAFVLRQVCFVTVEIKLLNLFLRNLVVVINLLLLSASATIQ